MRRALPVLVVLSAAMAIGPVWPPSAQAPAPVDFARDVQPLLRANCYGCHGASLQSGNFRLDRRRDSMPNRVGANGARIVPGNSAASRLYQRVSGTQAGLQMPPTGALQPEEIRTIKAVDRSGRRRGPTSSPAKRRRRRRTRWRRSCSTRSAAAIARRSSGC